MQRPPRLYNFQKLCKYLLIIFVYAFVEIHLYLSLYLSTFYVKNSPSGFIRICPMLRLINFAVPPKQVDEQTCILSLLYSVISAISNQCYVVCTTLKVFVIEMHWPKTGATHYHAQLGLLGKFHAVKWLVVCFLVWLGSLKGLCEVCKFGPLLW